MYVCVYTYIYAYIYIYVCIYTHGMMVKPQKYAGTQTCKHIYYTYIRHVMLGTRIRSHTIIAYMHTN